MAQAPSRKTRRLVELFPDAYAADDPSAVLHKLLDAVGASLEEADADVKALLRSHWVDYAEGGALDALAAIHGVSRRQLRGGEQQRESDEAFRQRLRDVVPLFTGGGTVRAVRGAVRSALGMPFDLDDLDLPSEAEGLRADLEGLVVVEEFAPTAERRAGQSQEAVVEPDDGGSPQRISRVSLEVRPTTVQATAPTIELTFTAGDGRDLEISRDADASDGGGRIGLRSTDDLIVAEGQTLTLLHRDDGGLQAVVDTTDVTDAFTDLGGEQPATLPDVPREPSRWRLRAHGARYDRSVFDEGATFDPPDFSVMMRWRSLEPLTFEVRVPYHLSATVEALKERHDHAGRVFVFEGLAHEDLQEVVDQTRAAGVRGSVQFSLSLFDRLDARDDGRVAATHRTTAWHQLDEQLSVGSLQQGVESHAAEDRVRLGGLFDLAAFDNDFGYF